MDYVEDAASNRITYGYETATGRQISQTDPMSNTSYQSYTSHGQPEKIWGSGTYPVSYEYDAYGRQIKLNTYRGGAGWSGSTWPTNPGTADTTEWIYHEASGLLTSKKDAAGKSVAYTYATGGKPATRTWARADGTNSLVTTYSYNDAGDMTDIEYSDSTPDVTFTVDRLGRKLTAESSVSSHEFTYDGLLLESETIVSAAGTNVLERTYDDYGKPASYALGTDLSVIYGYDDLGRLNSAVGYKGSSQVCDVAYSYLTNSDLISGLTESVSGLNISRSYETNRNLLVQVKNMAGTNLIAQFDYLNDAAGRRTQRIDSSTLSTPSTNNFGYNTRSELTNAALGTNSFGYVFDTIGNRTQSSSNSAQKVYSANALNQYTAISNGGLANLSYDFDGNCTNDSKFTFTWDCENRLIAAAPVSPTSGAKKVEFVYDYRSRRAGKFVSEWDGTNWLGQSTNRFIYDSWNLISEISQSPDLQVTNFYVWGLDLSGSFQGAGGIGGLLAAQLGTNIVYYSYDANGNVSDLTDTNSAVLAHYEYSPFGETIVATGALASANSFRFSTKYFVDEIGLGDWGRRWYCPSIGRWFTRDPLSEDGGLNLYAYSKNSPVVGIDLFGFYSINVNGYLILREKMMLIAFPNQINEAINNLKRLITWDITNPYTAQKWFVRLFCMEMEEMILGAPREKNDVIVQCLLKEALGQWELATKAHALVSGEGVIKAVGGLFGDLNKDLSFDIANRYAESHIEGAKKRIAVYKFIERSFEPVLNWTRHMNVRLARIRAGMDKTIKISNWDTHSEILSNGKKWFAEEMFQTIRNDVEFWQAGQKEIKDMIEIEEKNVKAEEGQ